MHRDFINIREMEKTFTGINTWANTSWYLVTCQGWGTNTVVVVVGACVVCTHAQSDPEKSLLSLFVSFIFLVFRRKRQYSNHKMFQKLENWIYFKSSSKECHQCTMFLSTVFVDFLNLKLCLLIIYSPLDTTIQLKYVSVLQWVDIFIFFNVFVY